MRKAMKQSTFSKIFSVGSIVLIILTVGAIIFNMMANSEISKAYEERFSLIENAELLKNTSDFLTDEVRSYALTGDIKYKNNYFSEVNEWKNRETAVSNLNEIGITDEEKSIIDGIFSTSNNLVPLEEKAMSFVEEGKSAEARNILYSDEYITGTEKVVSFNNDFAEKIQIRAQENISQKESFVVFTNVLIFIIFGILSVIQIINNQYFKKNVVNRILKIDDEMSYMSKGEFSGNFNLEPDTSEIGVLIDSIVQSKRFLKEIISDITNVCSEFASGNFNVETKVEYIGEFKEIEKAIGIFITKISETLSNINMASDQVAGGAEQLADGAQVLSNGAVGQADSVNKLADSISNINNQIVESAKNAAQVKEEADNVRKKVDVSNKKLNELIDAINEINDSSVEVSKIIKAIEDISFQTDILALNAAVEASRAGEHGKGFAVIADEVRNLAVKSGKASKSTAELIEKTINLIKGGTQAVNNTVSSLSEVFDLTYNMNDMIDKIALAVKDEASVVNEVNNGMNSISDIIQQNSATAEESAATSQELSAQAQTLKEEVHYFKIKKV